MPSRPALPSLHLYCVPSCDRYFLYVPAGTGRNPARNAERTAGTGQSEGIFMKLLINRRRVLGTIGAAAALGLPIPAARGATKIKVGALRFTSHSASFVALERGYFTDAGLEVEFIFFQAAQPMAVAIASRDIDYAVTAISGGLISLAEKGAIRVIGGALQEEKGIDGQKILASGQALADGADHPKNLTGGAGA